MRLIYWQNTEQIRRQQPSKIEDNKKMENTRMKNTTTQEALAIRTMMAELEIMNLKIDLLEREKQMDKLEIKINKLEKIIDQKLAK